MESAKRLLFFFSFLSSLRESGIKGIVILQHKAELKLSVIMNYDDSMELTLTQILNDLQERGYTFDFGKEKSDAFLRKVMLAQQRRPNPAAEGETLLTDLYIREVHRLEGMSDPSENSIIYAIETHDGIKGYLINAYGIYSEDKQAEKEAITPQEVSHENTYDNSTNPTDASSQPLIPNQA